MKSPTIILLALAAAIALACWLRLPHLEQRPMHADEGVNTFIFKELYESGRFIYRAHDHHGPTLYYATLPAIWLSDASDFATTSEDAYRAVSVVFGIAIIALLWLLRDALGAVGVIAAALLTALSPAMVFYSRYYIHEPLFIFVTLLLIVAGWRYFVKPGVGWAILAGASAGLMLATKETCVILWAAMAIAAAAVWWLHGERARPSRRTVQHVAISLIVALLVAAVLVSAFFQNPRAIVDIVMSYIGYADRAQGAGHEQPWHYYLSMLAYTAPPAESRQPVWSEAFILALALIGVIGAAIGRGLGAASVPFARFIAIYAIVTTIIFSLIPYKTPWNALPFLHGYILLAGVGVSVLFAWTSRVRRPLALSARIGIALLLLVPTLHLYVQAQRAIDRRHDASEFTPYVYAHTTYDVFTMLRERIDRVAKVPESQSMVVHVLHDDAWPLPWYLRQFEGRIGFGTGQPIHPRAGLVIAAVPTRGDTTTESLEALAARLGPNWQGPSYYALRPRVMVAVFTRRDLFNAMIHVPVE